MKMRARSQRRLCRLLAVFMLTCDLLAMAVFVLL